MKFSKTGQEKSDILIQVTTWTGLTVLNSKKRILNETPSYCWI